MKKANVALPLVDHTEELLIYKYSADRSSLPPVPPHRTALISHTEHPDPGALETDASFTSRGAESLVLHRRDKRILSGIQCLLNNDTVGVRILIAKKTTVSG